MKKRHTIVLASALSAVLLLAGCAAQQVTASAVIAEESASDITYTEDGEAENNTAGVSTIAQNGTSAASNDSTAGVSTIALNGTSAASNDNTVQIDGGTVTISAAGTYHISGSLENGSIIIDASKDDTVQLVLEGVTINADTFAAIYVVQADKVFVTTTAGTSNVLTNGGSFVQIDENNVDAVIYSRDDITFDGEGTLKISSPSGHGIVGKDEVIITGGTYEIDASDSAISGKDSITVSGGSFNLTSGSDGLHAENTDDESLGNIYITGGTFTINVSDDAIHANTLLQIDDGQFDITAAEGLEATYVLINNGTIAISASDDGINAANKSAAYSPAIEINDGTITIVMGAGDTDGLDSNGDIIINGGTIDITGNSAVDYDGSAQYQGGTIIVNGQTVNEIPNQMMGGGMRGGMRGGMNGGMNGGFAGGRGGFGGW